MEIRDRLIVTLHRHRHIIYKQYIFPAARDPRIEEMQGALINKDAKLNALQNTMAVSMSI